MTDIFSSFRQWILAQYAAIGGLVVAILNKDTEITADLVCSILIVFVVLVTNRVCATLWLQALRIGSFLVVHFELDRRQDPAAAWLLANRSESLLPANHQMQVPFILKFFRVRYKAGYGLNDFYLQQGVLLLALILAPVFWIGLTVYRKGFSGTWNAHPLLEKFLFCFLMLCTLYVILQVILGFFYAGRIRDAQVSNWIRHKRDHTKYALEYLHNAQRTEHVQRFKFAFLTRRRISVIVRRALRREAARPPKGHVSKTIETYDRFAPLYHLVNTPERLAIKKAALDIFLTKVSGDNILVAACGLGEDSRYLAGQGRSVLSFDLSNGMLAVARDKDPDGDYVQLDLREIAYLRKKFNGIWARACLYHLTSGEMERFFRDARRRLDKDGLLYFTMKLGDGQGMLSRPDLPYTTREAREKLVGERFYMCYSDEEIHRIVQPYFHVERSEFVQGTDKVREYWCRKP
ncbi:MAG: class I SAM-dependent methyltransferase [Flavobacteriales bacterium]|nr:class I SAM-dependent methyltransferase [Flavobacteriales bacterium]